MIESKGHKITPIDGDLAVSRNAEIGGDTDIHGKARVAGSLKVEGFLDAPNIKGVVKGLFATEEELKREYPNPRPGWCAIVLADKESGFLYLAKNREWEKQSEEAKPFEFIADSINVFATKGELASTEEELLKRLQGVSENSNASTDPFRYLGNLSKTKFFETIDALNGDSAASREECAGHFRAAVEHRIVDVYSEQIGWKNNVWVQRMVCPMQLFNKVAQKENVYTKTGVDKDGNTVYYKYRTHTYTQEFDTLTGASTNQNTVKTYTRTCNKGVWGDWKDVSNNYINSQNYGKKIAFFGGSFAQNMSLTSTPWSFDYQGRTYSLMQYIAEKLGATSFDDYAVGSQGVIVGDIPIIEQLQTAGAGYDIYVIFGGINDFGNETPLGESNGAANDTTYCGGLKAAFDWIRSNNKSAKIYTVTPFKAYTPDDRYWNPRSNIKKKGHTFYEFIQAQKEVAQIHGVPCFDLWANQQFSGASASEHYYTDLLHPNGKGYQAVADALVEFLAYGLGSGVLDAYAVLPNATDTAKGLMSAEDKKKFVKSITWNNDTDPSNMNDFVAAGVYDIKGERTRTNDNLPILNTGGGNSFNARLTVLDSSISGSGKDDDKCITQVLSFSNRLGQGELYIRTGKGSSLNNLTWENWSTLQRNVNVDTVTSLDHLIDNGIYSGAYIGTGNKFTFVMVVINDYALAAKLGADKVVNQFLYAVEVGGVVRYTTRQKIGGAPWKSEEILNKKEIDGLIEAEIKKVNDRISTLIDDNDPDTLDSIKDLINWVNEHGNTVEGLLAAINANADKIEETIEYAGEEFTKLRTADNIIKAAALRYDGLTTQTTPTKVTIEATSVDLNNKFTFDIPSATEEKAGIMSAEGKKALDAVPSKIESAITKESKATDEKIAKEKTRAEAVEQTLANGIANAPNLALRALFIAAGAEYNDSGADKTKTAPWGEIVSHKAGHYYLNDLGDITEEQMQVIYSEKSLLENCWKERGCEFSKARTLFPAVLEGQTYLKNYYSFGGLVWAFSYNLEILKFGFNQELNDLNSASRIPMLSSSNQNALFFSCRNLQVVYPLNVVNVTVFLDSNFEGCFQLKEVRLFNLKTNISFKDCSKISNQSLLYMIDNAVPTSAISITLHPDAYARLANDADVVAALAAQPLITLVSA